MLQEKMQGSVCGCLLPSLPPFPMMALDPALLPSESLHWHSPRRKQLFIFSSTSARYEAGTSLSCAGCFLPLRRAQNPQEGPKGFHWEAQIRKGSRVGLSPMAE